MAKIVCAGLMFCDILLRPVDRDVFDLDSVRPDTVDTLTGGDALNVAVNLAKLGAGGELAVVGAVGRDAFGDLIAQKLQDSGLSTQHVGRLHGHNTGTSFVLIESGGERHFICSPGANQHLCADDVLDAMKADTRFVHVSSLMCLPGLEGEAHERLFRQARLRGIHTSFDLTSDSDNIWLDKIRPGLRYTDTLFVSEDEAYRCYGGRGAPERIAQFFQGLGVGDLVLKLGGKGCFVARSGQTHFYAPAYGGRPVVDTTGAGDAFVAAFLFGQAAGLGMRECAVLGCANGFMATGQVGANSATASLDEMIDFIGANGALGVADGQALVQKLQKIQARE